ncbi:MAG: hypothetical protein M3361_07615 [Candidatus Tectomicrobia bacterium]|nr:hypothetical protein [Candidatus Tectomicrobia bacterium]
MSDQAQIDKLHQAIAGLEAQQRELGPDFTQQIAELCRRLKDMGDVVPHGSGAIATAGGVAAGAGGVAVGGDVAGSVFVGSPVYISSGRYTGQSTKDPSQALALYHRVLVEGCRHMSLRGLELTPATQPAVKRVSISCRSMSTCTRRRRSASARQRNAGAQSVCRLQNRRSARFAY